MYSALVTSAHVHVGDCLFFTHISKLGGFSREGDSTSADCIDCLWMKSTCPFDAQMFWSGSSCDTNLAASLVDDADGILEVDSTLSPWFEFDRTASGSFIHVCYKFNGGSPRVCANYFENESLRNEPQASTHEIAAAV